MQWISISIFIGIIMWALSVHVVIILPPFDSFFHQIPSACFPDKPDDIKQSPTQTILICPYLIFYVYLIFYLTRAMLSMISLLWFHYLKDKGNLQQEPPQGSDKDPYHHPHPLLPCSANDPTMFLPLPELQNLPKAALPSTTLTLHSRPLSNEFPPSLLISTHLS